MLSSGIHNWLALVAILAVTLLGAAALGRAGSERDSTMREAVVAMCERQNTGRYQIDVEFERLSKVSETLDGALQIAQRERTQTMRDAVGYAALRAKLQNAPVPRQLPLVDCDKEIPKP